jgi:hypothetical protein
VAVADRCAGGTACSDIVSDKIVFLKKHQDQLKIGQKKTSKKFYRRGKKLQNFT